MNNTSKKILSMAVAAAIYAPVAAWATNGMNLEGYGPIALGMGGASMAYDNGTAAVMNNPATIGLMADGSRLDAALGFLGPNVKAKLDAYNMTADSDSNAFYMPAIGWVKKQNGLSYGVGMFAQGGMGTEYAADTWMADPSQGANTALTKGLVNRSEVGVGRLIAPLTYDVNPNLVVGGSIDFVWAGMDIIMAMSGPQFEDLANPASQNGGKASGSFVSTFGSMYEPFGGTGVQTLYHAQFDFSNNNDFTGEAFGTGFAGKLGAVYKVNKKLSIGATYHSKTSLSDLKTSNATVRVAGSFDDNILNGTIMTAGPAGTYSDAIIPVTGKISVKDFEWPAVLGLGVAFQATDKLFIAADVKKIKWADVMSSFKMSFTSDNSMTNGGFANLQLDAELFQKWKDQTVISLGGAYQVNDALVVRAGFNKAANPIPNQYLNALFPAIVEKHLTLGLGYAFNKMSSVNFALSKAFKKEATNPGNGSTIPAVTSSMSQLNWQIMYSHLF
jgi:long-chain fatty acid transport protein